MISFMTKLRSMTCFLTTLFFSSSALSANVTFIGKAYSLEDDTLLYTEKHQLTLDKERQSVLYGQVDYFNTENQLISRKINQFSPENQTAPSFALVDLRDGYFEYAETNQSNVQVAMYEASSIERETLKIKSADYPLVIDSGFDRFLSSNWDRIMTEKELKFSFVAPSQQSIINFKLKKIEENNSTVVFSMNINNGFLAMLIDPIILTYDKESRRILSYEGLTNMRDEKGEGLKALIRYEY